MFSRDETGMRLDLKSKDKAGFWGMKAGLVWFSGSPAATLEADWWPRLEGLVYELVHKVGSSVWGLEVN